MFGCESVLILLLLLFSVLLQVMGGCFDFCVWIWFSDWVVFLVFFVLLGFLVKGFRVVTVLLITGCVLLDVSGGGKGWCRLILFVVQ